MKKQENFKKIVADLPINFIKNKKKQKEYGKNFFLLMTENLQIKKEKMNLDKNLIHRKMIW